MNIHGKRYASTNLFVAYCRDLNVKTDERELEYYEKIGAMFPVARVVFPDEYVIQMDRHDFGDDRDLSWTANLINAIRLDDRFAYTPPQCEEPSEETSIHRLDREMARGHNPYLHRPQASHFQPWDDYRVTVMQFGKELDLPTAEHYYGYWQVHQLYFIRKFSGLFQNPRPIDPLPKWLPEFDGNRHCYDALSLWITAYRRERERTFANVPVSNGFKRLDEIPATAHKSRLCKTANEVTERFGLSLNDIYRFLYRLMEIHDGYKQDERYKLAEALEQDIFACEHLLHLLTWETREQTANHLADYGQSFRHLSSATKERDYALDVLRYTAQKRGGELRALGCSDWSFTEADCNALLDYCHKEGLGLMPHALSGMNAVGHKECRRQSRPVLMYTNLKNILTAYEYLLKNLGEKGDQNVGGRTLTPAVNVVMCSEAWFGRFKRGQDCRLLYGTSVDEFLENLERLLDDSDFNDGVEGFWAREFLVTCLARNMTVHSFPSDDRYYGDLFSQMLDSVIFATLYTWKLAQQKGWV